MKKLSILALLLAFLFVGKSFAQPQVSVHVTGGYNLPLPDLKGTWPDDSSKSTQPYYMKSGFNAGADVKYFLGKKRNLGITLGGAYNSFSAGDQFNSGSVEVKSKINVITIGLGAEYDIRPNEHINPFIGAEFTGNFFSGKTTSSATTTEYTLKSASRFGAAFGVGLDMSIKRNIGVILGVKYNLANLIGKATDSTTAIGSLEYPLNDKENGTMSSRNISWLGAYLGVSFYFNRPTPKRKM